MPGVRVLDPSGQLGEIPESELDGALADGFTLAAADAPPTAPAPERTVRVLDPSGQLGEIPESELDGALVDGFTRPDPADGGMSQLAAAGEGLLGLGFTEPLAQLEGFGAALGSKIAGEVNPELPAAPKLDEAVQQARVDIGARKEANPWTAGVGGAVGTVAATLGTGGAAAIPSVEAASARATAWMATKIGADAAKIATGTLGQRIILQTTKALVPNVVEGAVVGAAQAADAELQAAYAVDGELNAGDVASVAEAGLGGLALGAGLGAVATGVMTAGAETARSGARAIGGMFGRGAAADDAVKALPSGETTVVADPMSEIEAIGAKRMSAPMPDAEIQPPPPVPGQSIALAQMDEAALGHPVSPYARGYTPGKAIPDAERAIDDQGHLFFEDAAPDARRRAERIYEEVGRKPSAGEVIRAHADPQAVQDDAVRSIIDDHDELLKIQDRARVLNGISAKRARIAADFDAPTAPPSNGVGLVLADGTQGLPTAQYRPDERTVATLRGIVGRVKDALGDGTTYELQELGGKGRGIVMAKAIQQKATEFEQALAQGKAGTGYMILDDLKRIFGDFAQARNQKIRMLVTGIDGNGGIYGDLQRHLLDEDVFMGLAQMQRPANEAWSAMLTASKDDYLRPFSMQAGERGANAFEQGRRTNGPQIRTMLNTLLDEEQKNSQAAFVRHGRSVANDLKVRAESWGNEAAKADALRAQVLVARIEAKRDAAAYALRAKDRVDATKEVLGGQSTVGAVGGAAVKAAQTAAKYGDKLIATLRRNPTPAESVAHSAVQTNAAIMRHAETAANNATGAARKATTAAAKVARAATSAALIASRASSQATIQVYARDTEKDSPAQRMKLNDAAMLVDEAPELVKPLQDLQRAKDSFLAGKLSAVVASGKVDQVSQVKIVRYINAAEHPELALERMAGMEAHAEDIETMWALYPSQMVKLRDQTMGAIARSEKPTTRDAQAYFTRIFRIHDTEYLQWLKKAAPAAPPAPTPSSATVKFNVPDPSLRTDELMR